ncbi:MAG: acetyltransferase [Desulfovibrionaceae bacterium]|jgi:putative acetyltransferase|nr:acetyltransferase [Desulfovibrionaceae bacterium]
MRTIPATDADHDAIVELWEASVRATHHFLTEEEIVELRPVVRDALPAVDLHCARDAAGRLHGFLGVADGKVEMLFLAPGSRGRGVGRMLLEYAVRELGAARVDVNEQNPEALGFYGHLGFRVVGRSPLDGQGRPFPLLHLALEPKE